MDAMDESDPKFDAEEYELLEELIEAKEEVLHSVRSDLMHFEILEAEAARTRKKHNMGQM